MPSGKQKSRTFRRVFKKLPGGKTKISYVYRKPGKTSCSNCNAVLKGVIRERPLRMRNTPKTKKRPERPYGGILCSKCSREKIKQMARTLK
jgi:large subunit ribosomal protein L34e